ncbi:hypothetical protein [Piscinibacter sp. XHJ-5]|uniref:hypothetical protein n=1 Tax=Piscinibacter sp. XHJ-5 TaxID=3037797 RepID=UPI0024536BB0|nr:hypothetical protein [Piscinibacter sp. XHJ-5]
MKTFRSLALSHEHGAGNRLAGRIGAQVAAVLLAVLVTPSTLPTRDTHPDTAALERGTTPRARG